MLEQEFKYYQEHRDELLQKYNGRFIVIKNQQIIGDYSSREEALEKTQKSHEIGTFLIQLVSGNNADQLQRFYSRATFNEPANPTASRLHN